MEERKAKYDVGHKVKISRASGDSVEVSEETFEVMQVSNSVVMGQPVFLYTLQSKSTYKTYRNIYENVLIPANAKDPKEEQKRIENNTKNQIKEFVENYRNGLELFVLFGDDKYLEYAMETIDALIEQHGTHYYSIDHLLDLYNDFRKLAEHTGDKTFEQKADEVFALMTKSDKADEEMGA